MAEPTMRDIAADAVVTARLMAETWHVRQGVLRRSPRDSDRIRICRFTEWGERHSALLLAAPTLLGLVAEAVKNGSIVDASWQNRAAYAVHFGSRLHEAAGMMPKPGPDVWRDALG